MYAAKVDADGYELGGEPVVLLDAPRGDYLCWIVMAGGARRFCQGTMRMSVVATERSFNFRSIG